MVRGVRGKTDPKTVLKARQLRTRLTESERVLWEALRDGRLHGIKFRRQHPFGPYVLDFFCVKAQLEIELDGSVHNQPDQKEYDQQRTAYLEQHGLRVLRFRNEKIGGNLEAVLDEIVEAASPTPCPLPLPTQSGEGGGAEGGGG